MQSAFRRIIYPICFLFISFSTVLAQKDTSDLSEETERILYFHSDIFVRKNCSFLVVEHIRVMALNEQIRHGIYRDLPLEYEYLGGSVKVGFTLNSITRNGAPETIQKESLANGIRLYIGDKDAYVDKGIYDYEISYTIDHGLGFFDDHDEVYWNVNGNGWSFVVDSLSATIHYPDSATLLKYDGFTGDFGERGKDFKVIKGTHSIKFKGTREFYPGENLTVAADWSKGHLEYPGIFDSLIYWIRSYTVYFIALLGILGTFLFNFIAWRRFGKDPKPGTIMPLYYPPAGLSAAECAYIKAHGNETETMFGATLISLATKEFIHIKTVQKGSFERTFILTINPDPKPGAELTPVEDDFFRALFLNRDQVTIGNLRFDPSVYAVQQRLTNRLEKLQGEDYFVSNERLQYRQYAIPAVTVLIGGIVSATIGGSFLIILFAFVLMYILNFVFSRLYEPPTALGRKTLDELAGFELYLKYADKERLRLVNPPTMDFEHFEQNLLYAIALGVAEKWAAQFEPVVIEQVHTGRFRWYSGVRFMSFSSIGFSDLSQTISSVSVPPSSSSGFGGGGSSGGGGFSGGGGGGGGGGGW